MLSDFGYQIECLRADCVPCIEADEDALGVRQVVRHSMVLVLRGLACRPSRGSNTVNQKVKTLKEDQNSTNKYSCLSKDQTYYAQGNVVGSAISASLRVNRKQYLVPLL